MRYCPLFLALALLLCGCHAVQEPPFPSSVAEPTTAPTAAFETSTAPTSAQAAEDPPTSPTEASEPEFDAYSIIDTMTDEALVGQLFLARCPDADTLADIARYQPGGFVLFGRDFSNETPDSLTLRISEYQSASPIPMLIAVDEEGGTVTRVSSYQQYRSARFPSPRNLFAQGGIDLILETETEKCRLLKSLGINVNIGPVCDITDDPAAFMYRRSLGESPAVTGAFAAEVCMLMGSEQVGSVLKHFPGYGNNTDTHTGIARDSRSLEALESSDLIPFRAGIAAGCDGILVSHTIVEAFDPDAPASLSPSVVRYLRDTLGFDGVILTDDLIMEAITDRYGAEESAVLAVLAGCDMLCSSEYQIQYAAVLEAYQLGRIPADQIRDSVARILTWKYRLGLLEHSPIVH